MLVKELRELLTECDGNSKVVLQTDPEGNGYWNLVGVDEDCMFGYDEYNLTLTVYSTNETAEDLEMTDQKYKTLTKNRCVVLYP